MHAPAVAAHPLARNETHKQHRDATHQTEDGSIGSVQAWDAATPMTGAVGLEEFDQLPLLTMRARGADMLRASDTKTASYLNIHSSVVE